MSTRDRDLEDVLNRMNPAANMARLGTLLEEVITKHNSLLAKLDADHAAQNGVVADSDLEVDYADTLAIQTLKDRL